MDELKEALPGGWLSILVIILLGTLSNATWEIFLKPIMNKFRDWSLSFTTLWKTSLKNNIYYQVSFGSNKHHFSLFNSDLLLLLFIPIVIVSFLYMKDTTLDELHNQQEELATLEDRAWNTFEFTEEKTSNEIDMIEDINALQRYTDDVEQHVFWFIVLFGAYVFYITSSQVAKSIKVYYIHTASNHVDKLILIIRPYISEADHNDFVRRYAQIRTKDDYVSLMTDLYEVADNNGAWHPIFIAW